MGQYRQWLHYRHVDQQLHMQRDQLTTAVKHLQEHINALDAPPFDADNAIMQALTLYIQTRSAPPQESFIEPTLANGQQAETISQALFDHSRLEPLHGSNIHEPILPKRPTNAYTPPLPLISHKATDLTPEATDTSSDEQSQQTQPQVALPWWLRNAAHAEGQDSALDAQSIRTNHLVQRWLERWGRQEEQGSQARASKRAKERPTTRGYKTMSVVDDTNTSPTTSEDVQQHLDALFSRLGLEPQHVETFYKQYQHWQLAQQLAELQAQLVAIEQNNVDNTILMQLTQPSPIALAALTRLQSYGVDDVDLLDNMLERGDTWLDHVLQLLEQCQRLGFIRDNYTEWCQHALEGAYDWLDSMQENEAAQQIVQPMQGQETQASTSDDTTETVFIHRLMSEEETLEIPAIQLASEQVEEIPSVGTDVSRPLSAVEMPEGRDEAVLINNEPVTIPSILSYPLAVRIISEESTQDEEVIPTPTNPIRAIPSVDKQPRLPKHGLVSRILSKVWRT